MNSNVASTDLEALRPQGAPGYTNGPAATNEDLEAERISLHSYREAIRSLEEEGIGPLARASAQKSPPRQHTAVGEV